MPVQIHLSETEDEVERCVAEHGVRPAELLDRAGLLGPGTVLAHGCWLDRGEIELIAERGATIVSNPVANLKLAVGRVFPYRDAREAGAELGLGTDGPGSNNSLDLLADAKFFALLQKNEARDPAAITAAETLRIATGQASGLLGGQRARAGRAGRLPPRPLRRPGALDGRARRRARLRRVGRDRRHHRRRRAGADARWRGSRASTRSSRRRASAPPGSGSAERQLADGRRTDNR